MQYISERLKSCGCVNFTLKDFDDACTVLLNSLALLPSIGSTTSAITTLKGTLGLSICLHQVIHPLVKDIY